jgi:hypothetical protein
MGDLNTNIPQKPTVWARSNKDVQNRAARDIELEEVSKVTIESGRAVLERKAKIYEKLRKGKSGGLTDKQYEALLVDVCMLLACDDRLTDIQTLVRLSRT